MILRGRNSLSWLIVFCLLAGLGVRYYIRTRPRPPKLPTPLKPVSPVANQAPKPAHPATAVAPSVGNFDDSKDLRVSDDAANKQGDFWLEQNFEIAPGGLDASKAKQDLFDLYVSFDPKTLTGMRVRLKGGEASLLAPSAPGQPNEAVGTGPISELSSGATKGAGEHVLGVLWRAGELSVWLGAKQVLAWTPAKAQAEKLNGASAAQVLASGLHLGTRRALALGAIRFDDSFMRESNNGIWKPQSGRWELTAMTFPERSANPFSLRAVFKDEQALEGDFYKGRMHDPEYGLGIMISPYEGTLHIVRITGGSPAARAGLAEDDIFLEIDGNPVDQLEVWQAYQMLMRGYTQEVRLRMLRPGEKQPRDFTIKREHFRWGTPVDGVPIQPVSAPEKNGADQFALISSGEPGWSDYAAEVAVKPLGAGGVGLAVAFLSPEDYLLFRWRGPIERSAPAQPGAGPAAEEIKTAARHDKLELVRVVHGRESVLAERPAGYRPYEFYRMGIDWNGEKISCNLDGNEIFNAVVPGLKRGQIALYALNGEAAFFDDVKVASDRAALNAEHTPERKLNSIFVFEDDMEVWANPALEWRRDIKTGWAVHEARFPGDQALIINKPKFSELTVALFCSDNPDDNCGTLSIKDGVASLPGKTLAVGNGPFQRITVRATKSGIEANIDGVRLATPPLPEPNSQPIRQAQDFQQPIANSPLSPGHAPHDRVAIRGLKNIGDPATVRVTSSNTLEYTFDTSPTDWKVECGRWGLLNKWICDPRWSWFGGRTKTLAALWNKFIFSGDISVEAHVALMMQKEEPPYERPGDYNIAICGDGVNLDSGYTLIFGGDNNSWTRLYRKGKMVAESWKEEHRLFSDRIRHPDKPDLHQRWFHLKLEKIGNKLSFYRDNALAFTFEDPEPLADGRLGFWTIDNGFLLSRVRIAHGGMKPAPFESRRSNLYDDARVINVFDGEVFTSVEPQLLPASIQAALATPKNEFKPADADALPPSPALPESEPTSIKQPQAYRVVNGTGGGPFTLQFRTSLDIEERGILRFAYRIEPGAQVDLYLVDLSGRDGNPNFSPRQNVFRWRLTGPKDSDEFAPLAGEVPGVVADGKWHAVQYDLYPSWRAMWRQRGFNHPRRYVMRLLIGNLDNQGYLLAGMNGNHAGAAYSISDFTVLTPTETDTLAPKVGRVIWPYDAEGDGHSLSAVFDDAGGSGVLEESVQATVNGVAVPRELLEFDAPSQRLRIDLLKLGLPVLAAEQTLNIKILGFQDRARNASPAFTAEYKYSPELAMKAAKPVAAPVISIQIVGSDDRVPDSGPLSLADVTPAGPGIVARLQNSTDAPPWAPYGQRHSIQVISPADGSAFGFQMRNVGYELRHWPYLELEYKVPPEMPFNLHFNDHAGLLNALLLTDLGDGQDPFSQNIVARFGPPQDFIADGTWRRSVVPLERLFQDARLATQLPGTERQSLNADEADRLARQDVLNFSLHDNGWRGNRRGMQYWFHRILPVPAGRTADFVFNFQAADISGIADYAACVDDLAESDPAGKKEFNAGENLEAALKRRGATLKDGWNFVHVRVKNGAGLWSDAAHRRFYLDNQAPKIVRTEPAGGSAFAGQSIKLFFEEEHGIDFQSLQMSVNGKPLNAAMPGMLFDPIANTISYDAMKSGMPWPEGAKVNVEIQMLKDLLGNAMTAPFAYSFNAKTKTDTPGPEIAHMRWASPVESRQHRQMEMETSFSLDFEEHIGHLHAMRDCALEWLDDPSQACFGRRAVHLTALEDDADVQVMLHKNPWFLDRLSVLQFDYKADKGFCVDLLVEAMGEWMSIRFTGNGQAPDGGKAIGAIEAVIADGTWRHASVDLRALIDAARPNLEPRIVNKFIFSAQGQPGCKRGSTLTLDNLEMSPAQGAGGHFEWQAAPDPTGINGYAFVLDRNANTVPQEAINQTDTKLHIGALSGVWYAHVMACDQAGNWGPVKTMRVDLGR